jgi:mRNA interferase MazF
VRAALDAVESVAVAALTRRLGRLSDQRMREVCAAAVVSTGCA